MKKTIAQFLLAALLPVFPMGMSAARADTSLTGAGATFPYPIYSKWFDEYHKLHPDVQINYQSIGSGGGIRQVTEGTVDFGATDGPMKDEQIADYKSKHGGSGIRHFPTVLGAVVPTYHLPAVNGELQFSPESLAGIFLGKITKWNDKALVADNPGISLPDEEIIVVHRSDGSGTTYIWTDYLSKTSAEFKQTVGVSTSVEWPVGLGGKGNEGVAGLVKQTEGAIGYVELVFASQNKLPYGAVKNAAGKFIKADLKSVTAAAASSASSMPADFRVSLTSPPGEAAYPIASFTWLLVPEKIEDSAKKKVLRDFLTWMLHDGQKLVEALEYAPLPADVVSQELKSLPE